MKLSRLISLIYVLIMLIITAFTQELGVALKIMGYYIWPLAFIWFPDELGSLTGIGGFHSPQITSTTPEGFVAFGGWMLLFMPLALNTYINYAAKI